MCTHIYYMKPVIYIFCDVYLVSCVSDINLVEIIQSNISILEPYLL